MRYFVLFTAVFLLLSTLSLCMHLPPSDEGPTSARSCVFSFALSGRPIVVYSVDSAIKFFDLEAQKQLLYLLHDGEAITECTEFKNADAMTPVFQNPTIIMENLFEFFIKFGTGFSSYYNASFGTDGVLHIRKLDLVLEVDVILNAIRVSRNMLAATISVNYGPIAAIKYFSFEPSEQTALHLDGTFELALDGDLGEVQVFCPLSPTGALIYCEYTNSLHILTISGFPKKQSEISSDALTEEAVIQLHASVSDSMSCEGLLNHPHIYPVLDLDGVFCLIGSTGWESKDVVTFIRVSDPYGNPKFAPFKNICKSVPCSNSEARTPLSGFGLASDFFALHKKNEITGGLSCQPCLNLSLPHWDTASGILFQDDFREFTLLEYLKVLECIVFNTTPLTLDMFDVAEEDKGKVEEVKEEEVKEGDEKEEEEIQSWEIVSLKGRTISFVFADLCKNIEVKNWVAVKKFLQNDDCHKLISDSIQSRETLKVYARFIKLLQREVIARDPSFPPVDLNNIFFPPPAPPRESTESKESKD